MFLLCNFTSAILFTVKSDACWVPSCVRVLRWLQWYTEKFSMILFIRAASKKKLYILGITGNQPLFISRCVRVCRIWWCRAV